MRDVDSGVITAMDASRVVSGRVTFRDVLPRWTDKSISDGTAYSDGCFYDVDNYGTGFLRVMAVDIGSYTYRLYYQYVSSPTGSWPSWTNSGIALKGKCNIALYQGRLFYRSTDNTSYYRDFNGSSFGSATSYTGTNDIITSVAPISNTVLYQAFISSSGATTLYRYVIGSGYTQWPGALAANHSIIPHFDAIDAADKDHIVITERNNTRGVVIEWEGQYWSDVKPIIPVDATDDTVSFVPGKLSKGIVSGDILLTGFHKREDVDIGGYNFHSYHIGKTAEGITRYTCGREMFITDLIPDDEVYVVDTNMMRPCGKLIEVGDYLWYVAPGYAYYSDRTYLTGYDPSGRKATVYDFYGYGLEHNVNGPAGFNVDIAVDEYDSSIMVPGAEMTVECAYDSNYAKLGVFNIESAVERYSSSMGKAYSIMGLSNAVGRLREWSPDAAYDYWSQAKQHNVTTMFETVVRASGEWTEQSYAHLRLDNMNRRGIIYSTAKASRGGLVVGTFEIPADQDKYGPYVGVMTNFYRETTDEAKSRLDQDEVDMYEVGVNGLAFVYYDFGTPTFALYYVEDGVWDEEVSHTGQNPGHDIDLDLALLYKDGHIMTFWKLASSTTWTVVDDTRISDTNFLKRDDLEGRAAAVMVNGSTNGTCYEFRSTDTVIPVKTNWSSFGTFGTVSVESEVITYTGKSHLTSEIGSLTYSAGISMEEHLGTDGTTNYSFANVNTNNYVRQKFNLTEDILCSGVDVYVRKVGAPEDGLEVGLYKGPTSTRLPLGQKLCSAIIPAADISTSYGWHTAEFSVPKDLAKDDADNKDLYILMTRQEDPASPDASNYYQVLLKAGSYDTGAVFAYFNDTTDTWTNYGTSDMSFKLLGVEKYDANQLIIGGISDPTHFDDYNDAALVVTGGRGEGRIFRVVEYDGMGTAGVGAFMLEEEAKAVVGPDSTFKLVPTLIVGERGYDSTTAVLHEEDSLISIWASNRLVITNFDYFSLDMDMRVEDVLREILVRSGSDAYSEKWRDTGISLSGTGWVIGTAYGDSFVSDGIVRFKVASVTADEVGVIFKGGYSLTTGLAITVSSDAVSFWTVSSGSTFTLREKYPLSTNEDNPIGWITMSMQETDLGRHYLSCWINQTLVASFTYSSTTYSGGYVRFCSYNSQTISDVDFSKTCTRVDNFIMDMGMDGNQLLNRLIQERRINYRDDEDGILYAYIEPTEVNSGSPYTLPIDYEFARTSNRTASRFRYHAYHITESLVKDLSDTSRSLINVYGNVFRVVDLQVVEGVRDLLMERDYIEDDVKRRFHKYLIRGAADPRVEGGDVYSVTLPSPHGTVDIYVDSVQFELSHDNEMVRFDMTIDGTENIGW